MTVTIKMNGKRISKKAAAEKIGKERLEARIKEAIADHYEDPYQQETWMDGMEIVVTE